MPFEKDNNRVCCEICQWCKDPVLVRVVVIEKQKHYICDECLEQIKKAVYADEEIAS